MSDSVKDLVSLCSFAGERFDLSQAGGGNASLIKDSEMWITGSGWPLSEIRDSSSLCWLDHETLMKTMRDLSDQQGKLSKPELERLASSRVAAAIKSSGVRPSIETLMHSLLGPLTLHTHPIAVTALMCRKDWRETVERLFRDSVCVEYKTPGVNLALALMEALDERERVSLPPMVFLQNHGLIVSAKTTDEVIEITNDVMEKVAQELNLDLARYRLTNKLTKLLRQVTKEPICSYLCEDKFLLDVLKDNESLLVERPTFPDQLVYCGSAGVKLTSFGDTRAIKDFIDKYKHVPKVILVDDRLFLVEKTVKQCRRLEEVLKAHVMMLGNADMSDIEFLSDEEQKYLLNWEAEKARQAM